MVMPLIMTVKQSELDDIIWSGNLGMGWRQRLQLVMNLACRAPGLFESV